MDYECADGVTYGACSGSFQRWDDVSEWRSILASLKLSVFPRQIVMGEPFELIAQWKTRHGYSAYHGVESGDREVDTFDLSISSRDLAIKVSTPESGSHVHGDFEALCGQRGVNAGDGSVSGSPCRTGATEKEVTLSLTAHFKPVSVDVREIPPESITMHLMVWIQVKMLVSVKQFFFLSGVRAKTTVVHGRICT